MADIASYTPRSLRNDGIPVNAAMLNLQGDLRVKVAALDYLIQSERSALTDGVRAAYRSLTDKALGELSGLIERGF